MHIGVGLRHLWQASLARFNACWQVNWVDGAECVVDNFSRSAGIVYTRKAFQNVDTPRFTTVPGRGGIW